MRNIALILFIASLTSCGFYKRQYTSGWMLSHKHISGNQINTFDYTTSNIEAKIGDETPLVDQNTIVIDTIVPENKTAPQTTIVPEKKEEEQDFYAPKDGYGRNDQNTNDSYSEELAKKTFKKRVKNASRSLITMLIAGAYSILSFGLTLNGAVPDTEFLLAFGIVGIIVAMVAYILMFYFTYKSFEIQINNPDVIFDSESKAKLIFPAVLSILFSGWIGLLFALILVLKSKSRGNKKK